MIQLRNVEKYFEHGPTKTFVLRRINLDVREGDFISIMGPSGAGKSTLLHLLPRLLDPSAGKVRVAGEPISELTLRSLRAHVGWVGQEVFLFDASVSDNLRLGAGPADLREALAVAGALEVVEDLPDGLATRLGERGLRLSGGQRQRLALARAILKRAPLLLLDEALSAVEPRLEEEILDRLMASTSSTLVLVTHRLRTAERFDRVLVFESGRLIEAGSPAVLLRSGGWFARAHALGESHPAPASPVAPASPAFPVAPASPPESSPPESDP